MIDDPVSRWMSSGIRAVSSSASVRDATRELVESRVSGLPVVDEVDRIVGVFSLTDAGRVLSDGSRADADDSFYEPAALLSLLAEREKFELGDMPVSTVMSRHVLSTTPDSTIREAAAQMAARGVHRLVVLGEGDTLRGVLTALDVCKAVAQ
jgi:CBS domain-containing protein